jgi:hypothetical protein
MPHFVAAAAYLGYGTEGAVQNSQDESRAFTTTDIGHRDDYGVLETERLMADAGDLSAYEGLVRTKTDAIRQQFSTLDREVEDVLIIIMMTHLLTPS